MVSAAKLRRAQNSAVAGRPYADQLLDVVSVLHARAGESEEIHPFLRTRPERRAMLILVTPDRGLTGSLVGNLLRAAQNFLLDHPDPQIIAVGRKGRDFLVRRGRNVVAEFTALGDRPGILDLAPIARIAGEAYTAEEVDQVSVLYGRFVTTTNQAVTTMPLLPIAAPRDEVAEVHYADYLFEPSPAEVLNALLPRYVEVEIYHALLEAIASEHAARMVAMHNATENAKDIVKSLTLTYNKARQAGITKEILEIAGGAEALRAAS